MKILTERGDNIQKNDNFYEKFQVTKEKKIQKVKPEHSKHSK